MNMDCFLLDPRIGAANNQQDRYKIVLRNKLLVNSLKR